MYALVCEKEFSHMGKSTCMPSTFDREAQWLSVGMLDLGLKDR